jgi:hypothetical protein
MRRGDYLSYLPHPCPQDRFEATQMLSTIGLERIQAQGLEEITFDLLKRKTYNEPFVVRTQFPIQAVQTYLLSLLLRCWLPTTPLHPWYYTHLNLHPILLLHPMFSSHLIFAWAALST